MWILQKAEWDASKMYSSLNLKNVSLLKQYTSSEAIFVIHHFYYHFQLILSEAPYAPRPSPLE